ncbi:flavodoxin domain-containing protein [Microbacterium sp. CFH 31415]|uniref:flavodoxin domain-containing protein n=1 Tax=Microbacterium sp. CFH 31415 TaxID=2921732 RepID=UPI0035ABEB39
MCPFARRRHLPSCRSSTQEIADAIADELMAHGLDVVCASAADDADAADFDAVVIGSAVYVGSRGVSRRGLTGATRHVNTPGDTSRRRVQSDNVRDADVPSIRWTTGVPTPTSLHRRGSWPWVHEPILAMAGLRVSPAPEARLRVGDRAIDAERMPRPACAGGSS